MTSKNESDDITFEISTTPNTKKQTPQKRKKLSIIKNKDDEIIFSVTQNNIIENTESNNKQVRNIKSTYNNVKNNIVKN